MTNNLTVWAVDDGYADGKLYGDYDPFIIPSFITHYRPKPTNDFYSTPQHNHHYISTQIDNRKYIIGKAAYELDSNIHWIGGENKHKIPQFTPLLKSNFALMSSKPFQNIDLLVMGLPLNAYTDSRITYLKQLSVGKHTVDLSYNGKQYERKEIHIKETQVKKQPFGSLCSVLLNPKGEFGNKDIAMGYTVVVDIGARTLNILTTNNLEEQSDLSTMTNDGIYSANLSIIHYLEQEFGRHIPDGKIPTIINNKEFNGYDLTSLIDEYYRELTSTIINVLDKLFINMWSFVSHVIFTGGGSEVLKHHLMEQFHHSNTIYLDRFATVKGLKYWGVRELNKRQKQQNIQVSVGQKVESYHEHW